MPLGRPNLSKKPTLWLVGEGYFERLQQVSAKLGLGFRSCLGLSTELNKAIRGLRLLKTPKPRNLKTEKLDELK